MKSISSRIAIFLFAVILAGCATAKKGQRKGAEKKQFQTGCLEGDCQNGFGTIRYADGEKYTGGFLKGYRAGKGVTIYANGDRYEGQFFRNVPDGNGVYTYADGTIERGDFNNNVFAGVIFLPVTTDESKIAIGKVIKINSSAHEIEVGVSQKAGGRVLKMGQKVFLEVNGIMAALQVTFPMMTVAKCKMIGQTQYLLPNVSKNMAVYEMVAGISKGNNTFVFPNGNKYVGEHKGNLMHGKGEFFWTNGTRYSGEFRNGMRHGTGTIKYYHGGSYTGEFKFGKPDGKGINYWTNGGRHEGIYRGGWKNGRGNYYWANGDRYEGDYRNDYAEGRGVYYWNNGGRYVGEFKMDLFEGYGTEYDPNGKILNQGKWANGRFIGK